jgi:predicted DNA-binding protein
MTDDATVQLSLRAPVELVERVDALVERLDPPPGATAVTRSVVLRLALEAGLRALEQAHPAPLPRSKR